MTDDTDKMLEEAMRLAVGAAHEERVYGTAEARKLQQAIGDALTAYWEFLERHGVITDGFELLVAKCASFGWDLELLNGAIDTLFPDDETLIGPVEKWGRCEEWPRRIKEIDGEHDDGEKV